MSAGAAASDGAVPARPVFETRTIVAIVVAGIAGFLLFLVLTAFAENLRSGGRDPRSHALSRTAVGFQGLVRLVQLSGGITYFVRDEGEHDTPDLLVLLVEPRTERGRLAQILSRRRNLPTLIVLPKWRVVRDPEEAGRVRSVGQHETGLIRSLVADVAPIGIMNMGTDGARLAGTDHMDVAAAPAPAMTQVATGDRLTPLLAVGNTGAVLSQIEGAPHYLLSDPDFMNNLGLADAERARAALQMLQFMSEAEATGVAFDLTLNGFASERSALRLAFEAPFLPLTIALFVAALLAGLHGAVRFGAAAEAGRAIAFGKSQLVENSAGLFKLARRERSSGAAYAELVREAAAYDSGAHLALRDAELDAYLDRVSPPDRPPFTRLAAHARNASDASDLLAAARALFQWKKDLIK